jgi:Signal transduction histidine kinase
MGAALKSRRHAGDRVERRALSVRARIVVAMLLVAALGLAVAGVATYFVQRERALAGVDQDLLRAVADLKAVAHTGSGASATSVDQLLRDAIQQNVPGRDESVLGIIDGKAALVPAGITLRMDEDPALVHRFVAESEPSNVVMGTAKTHTATIRYVIVPVSVAGDSSKGLYVAAYDLDGVLGSIAQSFQVYAIVAACAFVLIGLVGWFVAGRLLRPLRWLRDAAASNSARDLSQRIPVTGKDDVSKLASEFNVMFDRLEQSFSAQRTLLDDVEHELKTPITIVRGHLELMEPADPREVDATRALAIDELDRMSELVSEISLLAESRGPDFVRRSTVDLAEFTHSVLAKATALAPERQWLADAVAEGTAELDVRRVTQAWLQLADNAAKHSTPGTTIRLGSERGGGRAHDEVRLWMRDEGPGIPDSERQRVFERFVRVPTSGQRDGSGLGLAIVSAIAAAHGGSVVLSSSPHGSTFTMRIPIPSAEPPSAEPPSAEPPSAEPPSAERARAKSQTTEEHRR